MAKLALDPLLRRPNPLRAWRDAHGLTLDQVAEKVGVSTGAVFQIEDENKGNYSRAWLERLAPLYGCEVADLVAGPPGSRDAIAKIWERLGTEQRQQVLAYAEGVLASARATGKPTVASRLKKQDPAVPKIGGNRPPHVYLAEWMDDRNMEPEDLAKRVPDMNAETIRGFIAGDYLYDEDTLENFAKALRTTAKALQEMPPARPKAPAKAKRKWLKR